jgi:quercetin dioxygenase-like cupin family protein
MRVVKAAEVAALSAAVPGAPGELAPQWLEGPFNADRLDVAVVTMSPGGATPPHAHVGGQVLVVTAGRGFVEVAGERHAIETGDVIVCPPGEMHVHGAFDDGPLAHLTVTTRGYYVPDGPAS